jgi:hypothetical protein
MHAFTHYWVAPSKANQEIFQAFTGFISYAMGVAFLLGDA